jgi:hypothetical protein
MAHFYEPQSQALVINPDNLRVHLHSIGGLAPCEEVS